MRMLLAVSAVIMSAAGAAAAPRVWLDGDEVPLALLVANDSGAEVRGCVVEWKLQYADGSHYTEIAMVDLPANGETRASDCRDWWNERQSKTLDVWLTLRAPDGTVLARQAYEGVFKSMPRKGIPTDGWSATASRGGNPAAAFDGDLGSRWDTGGNQQPDDWYVLDMGRSQRVSGLIIDSRWSANDYPSGLTVAVSEDGETWTQIAEVADTEPINQGGRITLRFDPVAARHVKLVLTKAHGDNWFWSIHELSVLPPE